MQKVDLPDFAGKVGGQGAFAALDLPFIQREGTAECHTS